eukprot:9606771-Prorocentrum_lima.AAC.1
MEEEHLEGFSESPPNAASNCARKTPASRPYLEPWGEPHESPPQQWPAGISPRVPHRPATLELKKRLAAA